MVAPRFDGVIESLAKAKGRHSSPAGSRQNGRRTHHIAGEPTIL